MENIVNASAKHVFLFNNNGNGKTYFTNCTFKDITVGTPDRGAMSWEWSGVNYDIRMTSVTIDHIVTNAQNGAQYGIVYTANSVAILDRCIVRNINRNTPIINSNKTLTVRDSLFYNLIGTSWGALYASNGNTVNAYNCTFDGCSAVTNTSGGWRYFFNCSISNCTKVNGYTTTTMQLKSVNVYETDIGLYDSNGSLAVTSYVPNYRDPESFDFRLKKTSALVDAGDEAYVTWADPVDLLGTPRVLDGNADDVPAPDLGAYEYDPYTLVPTFATTAANYAVFAGDDVTIPVSIAPAAGGAVVADITLGFGLSGPGTLAIPDGHGPVDLTLTAASGAGLDTGNPIDIDIARGSGPEVEPTACVVTVYTKKVKVAGEARIFLPEGDSIAFPVSLMSPSLAALAEISFTVGAATGSGTNSISWNGGMTIPAGTSQSSGSLSITAGSGLNTVQFTVSGGFTFAETGTDTLNLDVIGFASPIYVGGTGSDTAGTGSEASPLRSITKALALAAAAAEWGEPMEIRVLPGLYDTDSGETFKLTVPPGVSIVGTRGPAGDESDSAVLDAGGEATILRLATTPSGSSGLVSGLVMRNFIGPAVDLTGWRGTIDNCLITEAVRGVCNALIFYHQIGTVDLTVTNTEMVNMTNQDAKHVVLFGDSTGTGKTTFAGCVFRDITVGTPYGARGSMNWEWDQVFTISISDTVFDHVTFNGGNEVQSGLFRPSSNPFTLDRCTICNMNQNTTTISANGAGVGTIRDCLFYNNNNGSWGVVGGANGSTTKVYNSTFDTCSAVTSTSGCSHEFWNCSISNCAKINIYTTNTIKLHSVNVFNSDYGVVDLDHSDDLTDYDPNYRNPDEFDFRLKKVSRLIDAGDNSFVTWSDPTDLDGKPRIMDGNADEVETVDLGAYEYDPNVVTPTFTTAAATYNLFAGASIDVPVSIVPPAGAPVTAGVSYGTDLGGPATLSIPDGTGPAGLTVTAASSLNQTSGSLSTVTLAESSSVGVDPGEFGIYVYERAVTIGGATRLFVKAGEELQVKVRFVSDLLRAPGAVNVTAGTPEGSGTNAIAWSGDAFIPDGGWESAGYLSITGGSGANVVTLTVDNSFAFTESGMATVTIQVIGFTSPLYVSGTGNDESGDGSLANPLRTITYAASLLTAGDEVRVLAGSYGPSSGETMPIQPDGVRIVGDGPAAGQVIDGETTAFSMFKFRETTGGLLQNLTLTRCTEPAVLVDHATIELTGCTFADITCRDIPGSGIKAAALNMINNAQVTATDCRFTRLVGRSAVEIETHTLNNANLFVGNRCEFTDNYSFWGTVASTAGVAGRYELSECLFQNNRVPMDGHTQDSDSGTVAYLWGNPGTPGRFIMDRCTVLDGSGGCVFGISHTPEANCKATNCLFAGNQCRLSMLDGYAYGFDITNCTIVNNTGGFNRWSPHASHVNLRNCIIANNDYMAATGGVTQSVILKNCIVWNTPPGDGTGYNLTLSSNVIEQDPLLVDPSETSLDARLTDASPALDAGDDALVPADAVVDLDGQPRFHDANGDDVPTVDIGCYEYQGAPGATVAAFTVSDRTSGSTLVTNEADVTTAITVNVPEGITVLNWQITESDAEPAEWLTESPTSYTIQGASAADVTLYAWIKDSADNVASKPATIYYDTRLPVVSNVVIAAGAPGTATATWDTDIPAEGAVNYGAVSMAGTTPNTTPENAIGTSHSVVITGIVAGTNYKIILVNNEIASAPIYWPEPWPIEGDANMDCRVNILDLIFIRNKLNQAVGTGDNWKADVNEDTRINILDLIFVRNKLNTSCP